jgi:hypothetical protein
MSQVRRPSSTATDIAAGRLLRRKVDSGGEYKDAACDAVTNAHKTSCYQATPVQLGGSCARYS